MSNQIPSTVDLEDAAKFLEISGAYRVLRRLDTVLTYGDLGDQEVRRGLVLDIETTGLNSTVDRIIEIGIVAFEYGAETGTVGKVDPPVSFFEDPEQALPQKIIDLTGISDEMVKGQRIDDDIVRQLFDSAGIVIAHNAGFDRPFIDRRFDFAAGKPWACSLNEVSWEEYGYRCSKLECLLTNKSGAYFEGHHRAANDCLALLHLLARPFSNNETPMTLLLESAHQDSVRIWATGAPFEVKDVMKEHGYRWNSGGNGDPKAWWIDVPAAHQVSELEWLKEFGYGGREGRWELQSFDAKSRYCR